MIIYYHVVVVLVWLNRVVKHFGRSAVGDIFDVFFFVSTRVLILFYPFRFFLVFAMLVQLGCTQSSITSLNSRGMNLLSSRVGGSITTSTLSLTYTLQPPTSGMMRMCSQAHD